MNPFAKRLSELELMGEYTFTDADCAWAAINKFVMDPSYTGCLTKMADFEDCLELVAKTHLYAILGNFDLHKWHTDRAGAKARVTDGDTKSEARTSV